ncbi:MAG: low molecular weight protein-tyrosine-phosphatase [Moraxella sp.]|nr:low molecular weight protein-tyrosine-phosphatase [Moraxella sp.]
MTAPKSVLFVCLGNICRSPSAEAVMTKLAKNQGLTISFDSAGTANYHTGEPPDPRAIAVGGRLGYALAHLTARQLTTQDFYEFGVIFAMDNNNLASIQKLKPKDATAQILLFDDFNKKGVADPYYGDISDFEQMYTHIITVSECWLNTWTNPDTP